MKTFKIYFYLLAISLFTINTFAQDGTLDRTFGDGGIVKTNIETNAIYKQKLLPDYSVLILAGIREGEYPRDYINYFFIKSNEDGSIDESFGENGIATINTLLGLNKIIDFDVQLDGKIIVTGFKTGTNTPNCYLGRLNKNGTADASFGVNGSLLIHEETVERSFVDIEAIKVTNNDKYLIGIQHRTGEGSVTNLSTRELRQYNSNGTLDLSFGNSGIIETVFAQKILIDFDENIYLCETYDVNENKLIINKHTKDGMPDRNWGNSGVYSVSGDSSIIGDAGVFELKGFDVSSEGEIICAFRMENVENDHTLLIKLNSDGELDDTWGDNGVRTIDASEYGTNLTNKPSQVYFMPDGKIIWGGMEGGSFSAQKVFLARFNENGPKDNTFGSRGRTRFSDELEDTVNYYNSFKFVKRPNDEKLVIATNVYDTLYFARYLNNRTYSKKYVSGNVSGIWDVDTVVVNGDITIPLNEELTIKPNTYVYFTGEYKFDVFGTLTAKGTERDSIFFASDSLGEIGSWPYYKGFWYGITFHSTDENGQTPSSLDYCNIKYAFPTWLDEMSNRYGGGLVFYKSEIDVSNTAFTDCMDDNINRGVFTSIHSKGNIDGLSFLKTTSYRAGTLTLLSSDINVKNLYMNDAYGIYADSSKVKIKNSTLDNCSPYIQWGIVNSENSEIEMLDCKITNNNGIGIFAKFSKFKIEHTLIKNNSKEGGLFIESPSTFANCEIIGNGLNGLRFQTKTNWGTIFTSEINNCVIAKNNATGVKFLSRNNANITNCTIADNTNSTGWGGVINGEVPTHLKNCIVYNNGSNLDFQAGGLYTYSIIQGNYVGSDTATTNYQNIDPLFRDAANGDYHLQSTACGSAANSPGIDAGDPNIGDLVLNCESGGLGTKLSDVGAYGGEGNWWDKSILPSCHFMGEVSGIWDCETITIDGDIVIPEGDTLVISENVNQVLISGPYQIKVEGVLLAVGVEREGETKLDTDYIKFQGSNWKGIFFNNLNSTDVGTSIIENCRFDYANKMDITYQGGGAIAIYNSDKVIIKHSLFYANNAKNGGAMYIKDSNPHIEDCYFELNGKERGQNGTAVTTAGGALYIKNSNPYLHKLQFINNYSISGGAAMVVDNASISISNVLLARNETAGMGGAIEVLSNINGSLLKIVNMTSADNISKSNGGGTIHTHGENTEMEVINSIMYGNTKVELNVEGKTPVITYSLIEGDSGKAYFGTGCIDKDPLLDANYRLSTSLLGYSPAIDAGHPDSLDAVLSELEGRGSQRADMGYYGGRYSEMPVGIDDNETASQIPNKYELEQNYPNPFNPSTTIQFALPKAGRVSLKIYNILGQEVATLIDREMNAGFQKTTFDASHLSSGLYLYRIKVGGSEQNFVDVKKMLLLK